MTANKVSVVVEDPSEPHPVVEKPAKPMSAAQAKRAAPPRKPPKESRIVPEGTRDNHFLCVDCLRQKPRTEVGVFCGGDGNNIRCKACDARVGAITSGAFRAKGRYKFETYQRLKREKSSRAYKTGKLPKWMMS